MRYSEDEYLMLSGIQHFCFCRRQWALIHLEQQWAENVRTVDGEIFHKNAHDKERHETRGNQIIVRGMPVSSATLGISGECDVVEFHRSETGVSIHGKPGTYEIIPIEYKRGEAKKDDCDRLQLAAQAMCLEEMLCCTVPIGYLYYGKTKRRSKVEIDTQLREKTIVMLTEMHQLYRTQHTPKVRRTKACNACSLKQLCLPVLCGTQSAAAYMQAMLKPTEEVSE